MQLSKQNKQVVLLTVSTFIGLIVGVLNSVINTRFLVPELYGDVRYVQNIISFLSSILMFGYFVSGSRLLAVSKDELYSRRIRGILCAILGASIVVVMLVMSVLCLCSAYNNTDNLTTLYLISIPLGGNVILLNYVNTTMQGDNHIVRIALGRLLPSLIYCGLAYLIYSAYGATPERMLALFNGLAVVVLVSIIASTKPSFRNLKESFRILNEENKKYGFNVYVGSLASVATAYIAGITLGQFCDDNANVGFYTLAVTIAGPLAMLPSIIGTTYFKRFAQQDRIESKVMKGSFLLTIATCIIYIICIKYIVAFLYDDSYQIVGNIASWLAVGMSLHGLGDMFNRFLGAHGKGKEIRNGAFMCGGVLTFGSILFVYLWQIDGAVITKIASDIVYFAAMYTYYRRFIKYRTIS